ncbi:MAG: hypothetical protein ACE5EN_05590 [Nitrospinota bacterium]
MAVELYEVFFRDGSYVLDFGFTKEQMRTVGAAMEMAGFRHVEVGHGYGLGAARAGYPAAAESDETYLKTASRVFKNCAFGPFFIPNVGSDDDIAMAADCGAKFISVGNNITQIESAQESVAKAKSLGLETTVCLMKAYVLAEKEFRQKVKIVQSWEPDYITIMDSAGNMTPDETASRVAVINEEGGSRPGFHGHDNLSLAAANAMTAVKNGAVRIDSSIGGLGRSGGNAATEMLAALFQKENFSSKPSLDDLEPVMEAVRKAKVELPYAKDFTDILLGLYGLHSSIAKSLNDAAKRHGVKRAVLYEQVAAVNRVNPAEEEIDGIAKRMSAK